MSGLPTKKKYPTAVPPKKIRVFLLTNDRLYREAVSVALNSFPEFLVFAESPEYKELLEHLSGAPPDVVLIDVGFQETFLGKNIEQIRHLYPRSNIILTISSDAQMLYLKFISKKGIGGFITRQTSFYELTQAILESGNGRLYICSIIKNFLCEHKLLTSVKHQSLSSLSESDLMIISLIWDGNTSKEIAQKLKLQTKTIECRRHKILKKLNVKNSAKLISLLNNWNYMKLCNISK